MKQNFNSFKKYLTHISATILPAVALIFAMAPCSGKMYEPELPEQLRK